MSKKTKQLDRRIGVYGGRPPLVCAVTGQSVASRHCTVVKISEFCYFKILNKAKVKLSKEDVLKIKEELSGPRPPVKAKVQKEVEDNVK